LGVSIRIGTRVRLVQEELADWELWLADSISRDVGNVAVDVRSNIPPSKSVQTPVRFNSGKVGIMGVDVVVSRADQLFGEEVR
jgi:hypothetical protein